MRNFPLILLLVLTCCGTSTFANNENPKSKIKSIRSLDPALEARFREFNSPIEMRLDRRVQKMVEGYTKRSRRTAETILGKASMYFPVFDHYLEKYNVPSEIKYIAVIESHLKPTIKSKVGAVGLWQIMPGTARVLGLEINDYVDERCDIHKSTDAGIRYLSMMYEKFGDWTLAIAAYNCGPARVRRALRESKRKSFWGIRKRLPKETREYVARFVAAAYIMNYYHFHDLRPAYPDYNLQYTKLSRIYKYKTLDQMARESGHDIEIIRQLNPGFKKGIIPTSKKGYNFILPEMGSNDRLSLEIIHKSFRL